MSRGTTVKKEIWKMWKSGIDLLEIDREISHLTGWSRYYTLCFTVHYLHREKNVTFTIEQLRKAFEQTTGDFDPEDEEGSWEFLLESAGLL